jgi:hypothetical protein
MLAALDALIDNGTGGRPVIALKQVCALFLRVGFEGADDTSQRFDELMATIAMDLDDDSVRVLAPELRSLPGVLPAFASTVMSRFHEITLRADDSLAAPPASAQPPAARERRGDPRDPAADAADPVTLARRASPDQLLEIARLPVLPELLTNVLVSRGHMPAILAALANDRAAFARSSLTMLAELAAGDRALRSALLARPALPDAAVDRLLPVIGREARARLIMSGADISTEAARLRLAEADAAQAQAMRTGLRPEPVDAILSALGDRSIAVDDAIRALSDDGRLAELAAFATARLGVGYPAAYAMLSARLDHPAAILVKALGGGRVSVEHVMAVRRRCGLRDARDTASAVLAFDRQDAVEAGVLVKLVDGARAAADAAQEPMQDVERGLSLVG